MIANGSVERALGARLLPVLQASVGWLLAAGALGDDGSVFNMMDDGFSRFFSD